ncbi:MAG: transglycosylase SLT domain-containing protein [Limisphaerales bacterium]
MKTLLVIAFVLCTGILNASDWKPKEELLDAIRQVESSGGKFVYGDNGRSLGEFQMTQAAWIDVNRWRKARGLTLHNYRDEVFRPQIARQYASNYISILRQGLLHKLKREPTASEIYAAYNIGLAKFGAQCGYDIRRVNATTARKCREIELMISRKEFAANQDFARGN